MCQLRPILRAEAKCVSCGAPRRTRNAPAARDWCLKRTSFAPVGFCAPFPSRRVDVGRSWLIVRAVVRVSESPANETILVLEVQMNGTRFHSRRQAAEVCLGVASGRVRSTPRRSARRSISREEQRRDVAFGLDDTKRPSRGALSQKSFRVKPILSRCFNCSLEQKEKRIV